MGPPKYAGRVRFAFLALAFACSGPPDPIDAGTGDAGTDAGMVDPGPPRGVFVIPRDGTEAFFDLPFPSDLRLTPEGTVDLSTFPNPRSNQFVQLYLDAFRERIRGFGTNGAIYFRMSHTVDESTLPSTPEETMSATSSVMLVDVDPESPDVGSLHPVVVHYQEGATRYWSPHTIALRPVYGIPLASSRRYAAVVTSRVKMAGGGDFARDADFEALIDGGGDAAIESARAVYGDVFTTLETAGIARDDILSVTVFTTQDAIGELLAIRDWMVANYPPPQVVGTLALRFDQPSRQVVAGRYGPSPIFQEGEVPYATEGGAITLDASGNPTVHGEFDARFALAIPKTPMPPNGYPIVLYAHGTGGDYESFIGEEGAWMPPLGFAVMGVDQIHHGERNPTMSEPSVLFFNFTNPDAGRDNNRQSALDIVQQARFVGELEIADLPLRPEPVRFDTSRIYFMGHSQGGLNGPIYMAIDDSSRGGVLSAASGIITHALIEKTEPLPGIPALIATILALPGDGYMEAFATEGFTVEHPIATLVQTWVEVSDGTNYVHMIFDQPRAGFMPKSVLMTEGLRDTFSPPRSIEALAGAMRVPQIAPVHFEIEALRVLGIDSTSSAMNNVAGGLATAGIVQYPTDGHFAIYRNDTARQQVLSFFESLTDGSNGTITPP